jgi:SAM-dependent methyltransferase
MLVRSLRNRGLGSTLRTIRVYAGGALFDLRYGVRTNRWVHRTDLEVVGNNKDNAIEYQPIRVLVFRDAFNSFQIQPDGVFVDFGSGKGRALLLAILYGFHRVVGVEFAQNLCSVAEHNLNGFRDRTRRQFEADVVNVDAAFYPVNDDDCVFFFNNPFDSPMLEQVLSNIVSRYNLSTA